MIELNVNGRTQALDVPPDMPLLWALRETLGLTGTKFGCGIGACGACTVHVDGQPLRSCQAAVAAVGRRRIVTIEGLPPKPDTLHPVQQAWIDAQVPQCGYCQSGMIMAAVALLQRVERPSDADIDAAMTNLCRCGTYPRVRAAIHRVARGATAREASTTGSAS